MPKAVISPQKGLVQSTGSGFGIAASNNGSGLYHFIKEIDLASINGGVLSATNNTAIAGICTLPSGAIIFNIRAIVTEVVANQQTNIDLVAVADADKPTTINAVMSNDTVLLNLGDIKQDTAFGQVASEAVSVAADNIGSSEIVTNARISASRPNLYLNAGAGSNDDSSAHTTGKILIHIEYYGSEPATDLSIL